eukprot:365542-Chlamydomonas_euryale.AAC.17
MEEDAASSRSVDGQSLSPSNIIADSLGSEVAEGENSPNNVSSPAVAAVSLIGIAVLLGGGYLAKDQIKASAVPNAWPASYGMVHAQRHRE